MHNSELSNFISYQLRHWPSCKLQSPDTLLTGCSTTFFVFHRAQMTRVKLAFVLFVISFHASFFLSTLVSWHFCVTKFPFYYMFSLMYLLCEHQNFLQAPVWFSFCFHFGQFVIIPSLFKRLEAACC